MSESPAVRYILITPARNEAAFIEKTLRAMISQTVLPVRWVVVNDGSTDETGAIVARYAARYDWIEVLDMPAHRDRSFAAKAKCFAAGYMRAREIEHDIVGNLDADISFEKDYLEFLLERFERDPSLGVAGTIFEEEGYSTGTDSFEGEDHVAGGCQMFRRECFEDIGGYVPNRAGGVDWIAVTTARMKGWKTRSFREKAFFHHRSLGTAERSKLSSLFLYGAKDYYLGGHVLWEACRVAYRMAKRPYVAGGLAIGLGYVWAWARRVERPVSEGLIRFHQQEQLRRLRAILRAAVRLRPIDNFQRMAD